jgi:hypothetical protein
MIPDSYSNTFLKKLLYIFMCIDITKQTYIACIFYSVSVQGLPNYGENLTSPYCQGMG